MTKNTVKILLLPGFIPRFKALFMTGFQYIPYFLAITYQLVRLLPTNHPYLNPQNIGEYGIRHVIAEAANNLTLKRDNIDQIVVYILTLAGLAMMVIQAGLLIFGFMLQPASAGTVNVDAPEQLQWHKYEYNNITDMLHLTDERAADDLAYMLLDMTFGIPDMFKSCISTDAPCKNITGQSIDTDTKQLIDNGGHIDQYPFPYPMHIGLHRLLSFYSYGLLIVATIITIYFIITILGETAQTGTPFGKRFNKVWAPIRLVAALGLLIPISHGMNASQYIVLYAAKYGSAFASNSWMIFTYTAFGGAEESTNTPSNQSTDDTDDTNKVMGTNFVTAPNAPDIRPLIQFMHMARICAEAHHFTFSEGDNFQEDGLDDDGVSKYKGIQMHLIGEWPTPPPNDIGRGIGSPSRSGSVEPTSMSKFHPYSLIQEEAFGTHNVRIVFGSEGTSTEHKKHPSNVKPVCGQLSFNLIDSRDPDTISPGAEAMQSIYWFIIQHLWYELFTNFPYEGECKGMNMASIMVQQQRPSPNLTKDEKTCANSNAFNASRLDIAADYNALINRGVFGNSYTSPQGNTILGYNLTHSDVSLTHIGVPKYGAIKLLNNDFIKKTKPLQYKGWGGAGLWYNSIAETNGHFTSAIYNMPTIVGYPQIMQHVSKKNMEKMKKISPGATLDPKEITHQNKHDELAAGAMWEGYQIWSTLNEQINQDSNMVEALISLVFGTKGLYDLENNIGSHPLAQLSTVGRSMIRATIVNFFAGTSSSILGLVGSGGIGSSVSSLAFTIGTITLTMGFVLYYVLPFLPFIYFFFALGGWVKGIFEAMVGAPLWALAHIRIDGNGLPGQAAKDGYFLILEIFIRPILIVFGLTASILTFSAMVNVMHDVWDIVKQNVGGAQGGSSANEYELPEIVGLNEENDALKELDLEQLELVVNDMFNTIRSPIDDFFFTCMYTVIVYMIGMNSFKMIDLVPNTILRWMGQSISTFNDQQQNPTEQIASQSYIGGQQAIGGVSGSFQTLVKPK